MKGFSLIELMIVVLLIGILAVVAGPLTSGWVNSSRIVETQGLLEQAVGQARSSAQRNPGNLGRADAASALCLNDEGALQVVESEGNPASCGEDQGNVAWSSQVPATVQTAGADFTCLLFNNRGRVLSDAPCSNQLTFDLTAGGENETISIQ